MYSWWTAISGQVTCRSRVSTSSGNQPITSAAQSACAIVGPPGVIPAATAGVTYFRIVFLSTPSEVDTSLIERPAYQWIKISVTSTTSKLLLAIGSLARRRRGRTLHDREDHTQTARSPSPWGIT